MQHVVFYEPSYTQDARHIWTIRGGHRYASIIGDLNRFARVSVLMATPPPADDPDRKRLESDFGVAFRRLRTFEDDSPAGADDLATDLTAALRPLKPTVVSSLSSRSVGQQFAMAIAAEAVGARFIMRTDGDDIAARARAADERRQPFYGTTAHVAAMRQERIAADLARAILVPSRRELRRLSTLTTHPAKVCVHVPGVDPMRFRPSGHPAQVCSRFLYIGRPDPAMGSDIVETAADLLELPEDAVSITMVGPFEPGRRGRVTRLGAVPHHDLPDVYAAHDALLLPVRTAGFPQVMMEAMTCGLACIATRSLFEYDLEHEVTAYLIEPTAGELADAMTRLHRDRSLFQTIRRSAARSAKAMFALAENQSLYQRVLLTEAA